VLTPAQPARLLLLLLQVSNWSGRIHSLQESLKAAGHLEHYTAVVTAEAALLAQLLPLPTTPGQGVPAAPQQPAALKPSPAAPDGGEGAAVPSGMTPTASLAAAADQQLSSGLPVSKRATE
jgi:hypothetical protein